MRSTSTSNESYVKTLDDKENSERLALTDPDWIQFLLDHRSMIVEQAQLVTLTPETMYRYRYRIKDYLKDTYNDNVGLDQIFRIINRLYNDLDFNLTLDHAYIPNLSQCLELRKKYNTARAKKSKI